MRHAIPKDIPECLKRKFPSFTWIQALLIMALCVAYIVLSQIYDQDSFGVRAAFFASFIIMFLWTFVPVIKGDRELKRIVRRAVDERYEMCCECGYPVPTGAEACPECGEAWDPDQAHQSWKAAAQRLRLGEYSGKRPRDSAY